ncbi:MAG: KpsF/GutQ family sugar-phosphate isomerase [Deltaproteobacteria bacterium]|nr:KpsF/GutQ family sugar-phosphate isomerase [Deltaproteobacteria bacterium]MBW2017767.1 KpsF/GutQ family sugar-phosphate isomerase [Deltaproteobacteria bacterium]MBW2129835.1 KpsF/GutQ family sugar-phosphate isomerase [Deltaproteobacteria bacterium]MBW2305013.1 KpsF/GutQ family sugar-phosphate isomerase [Deltaproteobacteria bacterium]
MVIEQAKDVLKIEAQAILDLIDRVGPEFEKAAAMILESKGRVILTGMGKSGLVARKISATLNSTGTPSLFLHPAEAIHGDLGMVTADDIVLAISHSGQTVELNAILPLIRSMGAKIISFVGDLHSPLASASDIAIDVAVEREACPMGLAPTASTTAALAMGDALAVVLINSKRFSQKDFKKFHPGGNLGERLAVKVREVMFTDDHIPRVSMDTTVREALREIDDKGIGATLVVDGEDKLKGIITDGDLRRALLKNERIQDLRVEEVMSPSPRTIEEDQTAAEALGIMELYGITHLCIVDRRNRLKGVVHLHDLLGREEFRLNGALNIAAGTHP